MLEIKNPVVVNVFIFFKHNCLRGRLVDSNYFYIGESVSCTNFRVRLTPLPRTLRARS